MDQQEILFDSDKVIDLTDVDIGEESVVDTAEIKQEFKGHKEDGCILQVTIIFEEVQPGNHDENRLHQERTGRTHRIHLFDPHVQVDWSRKL